MRYKTFRALPRSDITVNDVRFLCHKKRGIRFFVTAAGGLVSVKKIYKALKKHLKSGLHPEEFLVPEKSISGYLIRDGRQHESSIDGIPARTLFPLDIDLLTGLDCQMELPVFITYLEENGEDLFSFMEQIKTKTTEFSPAFSLVIARLERTLPLLRGAVIAAMKGKTPVPSPRFFMTMGGTGSGKTSLGEKADALTSGNHLTGSLDYARHCFKHYDLYSAVGKAGHHTDDYIALRLGGNTIREGISRKALKERYHMFFDGTGIPYARHYELLVQEFHEAGFTTHILAADALMDTILRRVRMRLKKGEDRRGVPGDVVFRKHKGTPDALLEAIHDPHVDHFKLFDTEPEKDRQYTLAFTLTVPDSLADTLVEARHHSREALFRALSDHALLPVDIPMSEAIRHGTVIEILRHEEEQTRLLIVTDIARIRTLMKKRELFVIGG